MGMECSNMGERRGAWKSERQGPLGDPGVDGTIKLKWIFRSGRA